MAVYDIDGNVISSGGSGSASVYIPDESPNQYDKICKAINHRGWRAGGAVENSLDAYRASKTNGFYYVETDVRHTSDWVAILYHGDDINGTAVSSMTYAECLAAVPTLAKFDDFIDLCRKIALHPYIEIKDRSLTQAQVNEMVDLVKSYQMQNKVTWFGGYANISKFQSYDPTARLGILTNTITSANITEASSLMLDTNYVFLDGYLAYLTSEILEAVKTANVPLELFTFSTGTTAENEILALDEYVTGFTADDKIAGKVLYDANIV